MDQYFKKEIRSEENSTLYIYTRTLEIKVSRFRYKIQKSGSILIDSEIKKKILWTIYKNTINFRINLLVE